MTVDLAARPRWLWTGSRFFPYAAQQSGQWWVLRLNHGFPAHDLYTLFVDGTAVADVTGDPAHAMPLLAGIGALKPHHRDSAEPRLDAETVAEVLNEVARYADYGSEHNDPCICCSAAPGSDASAGGVDDQHVDRGPAGDFGRD